MSYDGAEVTDADVARWRAEAADYADDHRLNGMAQHWKATILTLCDEVEQQRDLLRRIATARRGDCGGQEWVDMDDLPDEINRMWRDYHELTERPCNELPN